MRRKIISGMLAMAMAAAMLSGCGSKGGSGQSAKASDGGKVLNISCWNEEFQTRLKEHYPGYQEIDKTTGKIGDVTVKWKMTPSTDNAYQNALDESLLKQKDAAADDKIDIFLVEADYALKYVNTDYTLDVEKELGISADKLSKQYQYTKDIVTDSKGNLKGVSWQACPGAMIYRRDVAKKVFNTDDPKKIQEYVKDWDTFKQTAATLKKAGYHTTSSTNDTYRVFSNNVSSKWVVDGKINIDEQIMNWVKLSKEMFDQKYTETYELWSGDWQKGFTSASDVFCYFGPAWFIDFTLGGHDLDGKWAATDGPQSFYWGGSWICGANGTDNKELVKNIIETMTCDEKVMTEFVKKNNEFVNNKSAMQTMAEDKGYSSKILGGQNPLGMFCTGADKINLNNLTPYDAGCNEEFQKAMKDYFEGHQTLEAALDMFYKNVETKYPELKH
ncbi:MAG: ABC transporter substrate-binding protein [bacterium]|nr:ABC transporter substrate-binding protein [bacterium]